MKSGFLEILNALHDHHVEFVIVGGVAAALHGGSRVTFDLDLVPSLAPNSWEAAVDLLWSLGARPRIPEPVERIRDVEHVRRWRREKGMLALNTPCWLARREQPEPCGQSTSAWYTVSTNPSRKPFPRAGDAAAMITVTMSSIGSMKKRVPEEPSHQ